MWCLSCRIYFLFLFCFFQAASVSLQGFLNSMVYAWSRPNFTEAVLGETTPLVPHAPLAFFDESLTSSLWLFPLNASRDTVVLRELTYWPPEEDWPHACTLHEVMSDRRKHKMFSYVGRRQKEIDEEEKGRMHKESSSHDWCCWLNKVIVAYSSIFFINEDKKDFLIHCRTVLYLYMCYEGTVY